MTGGMTHFWITLEFKSISSQLLDPVFSRVFIEKQCLFVEDLPM
jgi:hypothetical protein